MYRIRQVKKPQAQPFLTVEELGLVSKELLDMVTAPPKWKEAIPAVTEALGDWLDVEKPGVRIFAPPNLDSKHDALLLRQKLHEVILTSPYLYFNNRHTVNVVEKRRRASGRLSRSLTWDRWSVEDQKPDSRSMQCQPFLGMT